MVKLRNAILIGVVASFIASFLFWLILVKVNPSLKITTCWEEERESNLTELYVRIQPVGCMKIPFYDIKIYALLSGKAGVHFKKILGSKFEVFIPLYNNGNYPILEHSRERKLEIPMLIKKKSFWQEIYNQLSNDSSYKEKVLILLNNSSPSPEEFIDLFKDIISIYDEIKVVVQYQNAFSGLRNSVRNKKDTKFEEMIIK